MDYGGIVVKSSCDTDGLLFEAVFENTAIGIALMDLEGRMLKINPAFQKMLGFTEEELHDQNFNRLFHPDDPKFGNYFLVDLILSEHTQYQIEKRFIGKGGLVMWGRLTVSLVRGSGLESQFLVAMIEDITKRKQMEEELIKSQKFESMAMLAGGVAHDFNNILAGILANVQLAEILYAKGKDISKNLSKIVEAVKRAANLTKQLLTFAKGGMLVKKITSIVELIKATMDFILCGSSVKSKYSFPEDIWPVEVDEGQLSQVIHNLVINAVQAMPDGGKIYVSGENIELGVEATVPLPGGKYVKVVFEDTGSGIPEGFLSKIFDPYFTTKEKGSGLGLATSYSIIKKHGGYIGVESTPAKGTTFYIYLPSCNREAHLNSG
jgi:PAS domain S-box-containing protein